jgi:hypothetical protein
MTVAETDPMEVIRIIAGLQDPVSAGVLAKVKAGAGYTLKEKEYADLLVQPPCKKCGMRPRPHLSFHYYENWGKIPECLLAHFCGVDPVYRTFSTVEEWKEWVSKNTP